MNTFLLYFVLAAIVGIVYSVISSIMTGTFRSKRPLVVIAILVLLTAAGFLVSERVQEPAATTIANGNSPAPVDPENPKPNSPTHDLQRTPPESEEDAFARKYLLRTGSFPSGRPRWTVVIADEAQTSFPELSSAARNAVSEAGYTNIVIFRPSLVQDGKFNDLFADDPVLVRLLHGYCDGMVLGKASSALRKDDGEDGVFTVDMSVQMRIISTLSEGAPKDFRVSQNGAGFTPAEAKAQAEARLAPELKGKLKDVLRGQ